MFAKVKPKKRKDINRPPKVGQYYDDSGKKMSMRKIKQVRGMYGAHES